MHVEQLSSEKEPDWDAFVLGHQQAVISYTLRYRDLLKEILGCQPIYALAVEKGRITGVMPVMSADGPFGTVLNALPYFGSNGAPLVTTPAASQLLLEWYADLIASHRSPSATMIENPLAPLTRPPPCSFVDARVAHITPRGGKDAAGARVAKLIESSARRNVRKAERLAVRVTVENDAFVDLERLHRASMQSIGARMKSHRFFVALQDRFRPDVDFRIYVARVSSNPVAALLVFYTGTTVDYFMPAASPDHRETQAMAPILLRAMTEAADEGRLVWNWGGSPRSQASLQRFKAKWGGTPHTYHYYVQTYSDEFGRATAETLLDGYPGFFVFPFDRLQQEQ